MTRGEEDCVIEPLSPLRRVIAARMVEAKQTIPHFRVHATIETGALQSLRETLRAKGECPSMNAFVVKACACALTDVRELNIQWDEQAIRHFDDADISIVTAVPGGLTTPILRQANRKSIWEIAEEAKELAARALRQDLKMSEIFGGTFSVSNLGMFGAEQFDAIINPPQCAILAVGGLQQRYLPDEADQPRLTSVIICTLSVDHRAIDGATAASFMCSLRGRLEEPISLFGSSQ